LLLAPGLLAVLGFAAVYYNKVAIDVALLLKALACLQLSVSAFTIVTNKFEVDRVSCCTAAHHGHPHPA
jgi:uncharacterized membrane protein (Fun14 family)